MHPSSGSRLPGIEGLRAIAAGSILVLHVWELGPPRADGTRLGGLDRFMPDLAFGVILFFTLSGFLLYRPFAGAIIRARPLPSIRQYLLNRALRILPAYWVILVLLVLLGAFLFWDPSGRLVNGRVLDPILLAKTATFVHGYGPSTVLVGIGPAWSLAVEVVFYCVLPLLALVAAAIAVRRRGRTGRRWAALAPPALLLAVGLTGKAAAAFLVPPDAIWSEWTQTWHAVLARSFWCQADLFAFGMALAVVHVDWQDGALRLPSWWRRAAALAGAGIYVGVATFSTGGRLGYPPVNTLMAVACALLLALVVLKHDGSPSPRIVRVLEARALVAAGVVSYSVFLWHEPLIRLLNERGLTLAGPSGFAVNLVFAAAVVAVASTATYLVVEAPALRLKSGRGRRRKPVPAAQVEAAP